MACAVELVLIELCGLVDATGDDVLKAFGLIADESLVPSLEDAADAEIGDDAGLAVDIDAVGDAEVNVLRQRVRHARRVMRDVEQNGHRAIRHVRRRESVNRVLHVRVFPFACFCLLAPYYRRHCDCFR